MDAGGSSSPSPAEKIVAGLAKVSLVMRHQWWCWAGPRGLTPTQSQILAIVAGATGPASLTTVARQMAITLATASDAVAALEAKGLVRKETADADRRAMVICLTRAGARLARQTARWPGAMLEAVEALPTQEQAALLRGLIGIIRELQERGQVPTARMCVGCTYFRPHEYPGSAKPHHCLYIGAPIGDADLRVDCAEMQPASPRLRVRLWSVFVRGRPLDAYGPGRRRSPSKSRRITHINP